MQLEKISTAIYQAELNKERDGNMEKTAIQLDNQATLLTLTSIWETCLKLNLTLAKQKKKTTHMFEEGFDLHIRRLILC